MPTKAAVPARVVIVGAGYAGLTAFFDLQERYRRNLFHLTLVDRDEYHTFVTRLYTIAGGDETEEDVTLPLRPLVRPPAELVTGVVTALDVKRQFVLLEQERLPYDYVVIAIGSEPEYFGVPGAAEYSYEIGNLQAAQRVRARLRDLVARQGQVRVVVAGGGLTGVEVAGELADTYKEKVQVHLVEATAEIMPGFAPPLARAARQLLESKAVRVHTGRPIARVSPATVLLQQPADRAAAQRFIGYASELPYDVLIWAGGVRGPTLLAEAGLAVTDRGRAKVDEFQRAEGYESVYVVGDAAAFVDPATGREVPPTAQAAVQGGRAVARTLLAELTGAELVPFRPQLRGFFASIGHRDAVGQLGEWQLYGLPAFSLKRLIEAHHAWETGGLHYVLRRSLKHLLGERRGVMQPE